MNKIYVFDLGGTLMEYTSSLLQNNKGMPFNWSDFYVGGFSLINQRFNLGLSKTQIDQAVEILKSHNPRICGRQNEILAADLFRMATKNWNVELDIPKAIEVFFENMKLTPVIYNYSIPLLQKLKSEGNIVCCLTDLPSGMPDSIFKPSITELLPYFDLYVSSEVCGFRKPNKAGLEFIANHFNVPVTDLIFIGDEQKDIDCAKNAGCEFVHISKIIKL